jgi:hypothetical protein
MASAETLPPALSHPESDFSTGIMLRWLQEFIPEKI